MPSHNPKNDLPIPFVYNHLYTLQEENAPACETPSQITTKTRCKNTPCFCE